jgi:hypothetical protein
MPRLSLWKEQKGNDYRFIDRQVAEMFVRGGTGVYLHKYLGTIPNTQPTTDLTKPNYATASLNNIQDLLFLENRDRKYDTNVFSMRGIYQRSDYDFDLSQFGLFLQNGTIMMTFHYNTMIDTIGRKIMAGDVIELLHLKDYDPMGDFSAALKRYYVAGDCSFAAEGFSPTWYPHLWRVKFDPLVDSQEFKDILDNIKVTNSNGPMGTSVNEQTLGDLMSTYTKYMAVNDAIVQQAAIDVPKSGYDVSKIYSPLTDFEGNTTIDQLTADNITITASNMLVSGDEGSYSPTIKQNPDGYLTGDGLAPNGLHVDAGVAFPSDPIIGNYFLRLDYLPNRLFRFDGKRWQKVEDNVRCNLTNGAPDNTTLRNSFPNNTNTLTLKNGDVVPSRQALNEALRPPKNI